MFHKTNALYLNEETVVAAIEFWLNAKVIPAVRVVSFSVTKIYEAGAPLPAGDRKYVVKFAPKDKK